MQNQSMILLVLNLFKINLAYWAAIGQHQLNSYSIPTFLVRSRWKIYALHSELYIVKPKATCHITRQAS